MVWEWFGRGVERKRGFWARETHELGGGGRLLLLLLLLLLLRPAPFEAEDDDEDDGRERENTGARRRHRCVRGCRPRARLGRSVAAGEGAHARAGGGASAWGGASTVDVSERTCVAPALCTERMSHTETRVALLVTDEAALLVTDEAASAPTAAYSPPPRGISVLFREVVSSSSNSY